MTIVKHGLCTLFALATLAVLPACSEQEEERARDSFEQSADRFRDTVEDVGSAARETVESAAERTEEAVEQVGDAARDTLDTAREKADELREEHEAARADKNNE